MRLYLVTMLNGRPHPVNSVFPFRVQDVPSYSVHNTAAQCNFAGTHLVLTCSTTPERARIIRSTCFSTAPAGYSSHMNTVVALYTATLYTVPIDLQLRIAPVVLTFVCTDAVAVSVAAAASSGQCCCCAAAVALACQLAART
jgi:hypothetical protein